MCSSCKQQRHHHRRGEHGSVRVGIEEGATGQGETVHAARTGIHAFYMYVWARHRFFKGLALSYSTTLNVTCGLSLLNVVVECSASESQSVHVGIKLTAILRNHAIAPKAVGSRYLGYGHMS